MLFSSPVALESAPDNTGPGAEPTFESVFVTYRAFPLQCAMLARVWCAEKKFKFFLAPYWTGSLLDDLGGVTGAHDRLQSPHCLGLYFCPQPWL